MLIEMMAGTLATKPEQVTCFVEGSIKEGTPTFSATP